MPRGGGGKHGSGGFDERSERREVVNFLLFPSGSVSFGIPDGSHRLVMRWVKRIVVRLRAGSFQNDPTSHVDLSRGGSREL